MAEDEQELAIGIDLGTTNSCVAVYRRGRVEVIINDQGHNVTPSYVAFDDTDRLVGEAAHNQASRNSFNTIFESKRLIGRQWTEQTVQDDIKRWPFKVVQGTGGWPEIIVQHKGAEKILKPEEVASAILVKMREIAEAKLNTTVKNAVITVPAHFNDSQRRATRDAGVIAGLNVMRIINEPTAAALAYGLDKLQDTDGRQKKHILVFDLGGGTLDVTIILMQDGVLKVKSTLGDAHLGGEDFTGRLVNYVADQFKKKHKLDISGNKRALARLRTPCEMAKKVLSYQTTTNVEVDSIVDGINLLVRVTQAKFEELNMDLFENCINILDKCVCDLKNVTKDAIDEIVLVGGSTRIPKIQEMVKQFFDDKKLNMTLHPDEAVACGAAIQAANMRPTDYETLSSIVLVDVVPLSLGIELQGGLMEVQLRRNTPIPARKERVFKTAVDGQKTATIKVFEGERRLTSENHRLGEFTLEGIPIAGESAQYIHITFSVDADGILTITAEHRSGGLKKEMVVSNKHGRLTEEEIERMVEEAERYRSEDEEKKKTVEARNELESFVSSVKHKMKYGKLSLSGGDKAVVDAALSRASDCFEREELGELSEYEAAMNELERVLTEKLNRVKFSELLGRLSSTVRR